jgi:hypothetical protein
MSEEDQPRPEPHHVPPTPAEPPQEPDYVEVTPVEHTEIHNLDDERNKF